jgi:TIR domain
VSLPRVFISYSRDSNEHKAWVRQFAERLRADGVDVILDQWDLGLGADVTEFMERSLSSCDRVLVICTERYVQKANTLKDGVGYERMIITAQVARDLKTVKFIPVLRGGEEESLPRFLGSRIYCDFRSGEFNEASYEELLRELHNAPKFAKPPVGRSPFPEEESTKIANNLKRPNFDTATAKYHWHRAVHEYCGNRLYLIFVRFSKDSIFIKETILDDVRRSGISDYIVFSLLSTWDALVRVWANQESIELLRKKLGANIDVHPEKQPEYLIVDDITHFSEDQSYKSYEEVRRFAQDISLNELRDVQEKGSASTSFERLRSRGLLLEDSNRYHPHRIQFYTLIRSMYNLEPAAIKRLRQLLTGAKTINNRSLFITSGSSARAVLKGQVDNFYDIVAFIKEIAPEVTSVNAVTETMLVASPYPNQSTTIDFQEARAFIAYKEFRELCPGAWQLGLSEQRKLEGMYAGIRDELGSDNGGLLLGLIKAKAADSTEQLNQILGTFFPLFEKALRDKLVPMLMKEYDSNWQSVLDNLKKTEGVAQSNKASFTLGDSLKIYKRMFLEKRYFVEYSDQGLSNLIDTAASKRNEFAHGYTDLKRWDELFSFFSEFTPIYAKIKGYLDSLEAP